MILAGDMTFASGKIQGRNVMSPISVLELDSSRTSGQGQQLVSKADTKDGNLGTLHQLSEMVNSILAMSWVSRPIGNENTIEVMGHLMDRIIERETGNASTSAHQTTKNILLHSTVDDSDMSRRRWCTDMEWCLRAHFPDQVNLLRVDECSSSSWSYSSPIVILARLDPCSRK